MTAAAPLFLVVRGNPSGEETAALAVVLAAKLAAGPAHASRPGGRTAGGWGDHARAMRTPPALGPGSWRNSARPG
jgi:hypothetical protein